MAMNQRQGVYAAIVAVLGTVPHSKVELSEAQLKQVHQLVAAGLIDGTIDLKGDRSVEWVTKYVPGLVNNWLRKDKALNGNVEYEPKNPGSRTGSGDETMRAMKGLLEITSDSDARKLIEAEIAKRSEQLKPKVEINLDKLPESLRSMLPAGLAGKVVVAVPPIRRPAATPPTTTEASAS
jgi:hypothetical protein